MGVLGPKSMTLVRDLGRRIRLETGEPRSTDYLLQRLSTTAHHLLYYCLFIYYIIY